jgi:hypothetical protein
MLPAYQSRFTDRKRKKTTLSRVPFFATSLDTDREPPDQFPWQIRLLLCDLPQTLIESDSDCYETASRQRFGGAR